VTLLVELVVPDRELWSGEARTVIAKTAEGDIGVLTGHSPVFGILAEGSLVEILCDGAHWVGVVAEDLDQAALGQHAEHRRMTGQHADVALRRLGDHRPGLAGPQLAVRHHQRYSQGHRSSSLAFFSTSSIPPTM